MDFFTKRDFAMLFGVVASVIVTKFIFPDEIYEVTEPEDVNDVTSEDNSEDISVQTNN